MGGDGGERVGGSGQRLQTTAVGGVGQGRTGKGGGRLGVSAADGDG